MYLLYLFHLLYVFLFGLFHLAQLYNKNIMVYEMVNKFVCLFTTWHEKITHLGIFICDCCNHYETESKVLWPWHFVCLYNRSFHVETHYWKSKDHSQQNKWTILLLTFGVKRKEILNLITTTTKAYGFLAFLTFFKTCIEACGRETHDPKIMTLKTLCGPRVVSLSKAL